MTKRTQLEQSIIDARRELERAKADLESAKRCGATSLEIGGYIARVERARAELHRWRDLLGYWIDALSKLSSN